MSAQAAILYDIIRLKFILLKYVLHDDMQGPTDELTTTCRMGVCRLILLAPNLVMNCSDFSRMIGYSSRCNSNSHQADMQAIDCMQPSFVNYICHIKLSSLRNDNP